MRYLLIVFLLFQSCRTVEIIRTETERIRDTVLTIQPTVIDRTIELKTLSDSMLGAIEKRGVDTVTRVRYNTNTKELHFYHKPDSVRVVLRDTVRSVEYVQQADDSTSRLVVTAVIFVAMVGALVYCVYAISRMK